MLSLNLKESAIRKWPILTVTSSLIIILSLQLLLQYNFFCFINTILSGHFAPLIFKGAGQWIHMYSIHLVYGYQMVFTFTFLHVYILICTYYVIYVIQCIIYVFILHMQNNNNLENVIYECILNMLKKIAISLFLIFLI